MTKNKDIKKKKKKKFNWGKVLIWIALIAMIGSALLAILSPMIYGTVSN
ncbi:MAG: hypothetical protein MR296_00090 [Tenericutes bacterium]|nr:hypothetical protein [Mycoplasmatota bacterium]